MSIINSLIKKKTPSSYLLIDAYFYYLIKKSINNFLSQKFPHIDLESENLQYSIFSQKAKGKIIKVSLKTTDNILRNTFKMEQYNIKNEILTILSDKMIFKNLNIELTIFNR
jgi:hypothetical protein